MDNAVWHLTSGAMKLSPTLRLLLTDYRWIRKKTEGRGTVGVAEDCTLRCSHKLVRENSEECALHEGGSGRTPIRGR